MGKLKPGASLVYERDGATVYQREVGSDPSTRTEVGHDYSTYEEHRDQQQRNSRQDLIQQMRDNQLWGNIRRAARTNPALQNILDQAIMMYHLTRTKSSK